MIHDQAGNDVPIFCVHVLRDRHMGRSMTQDTSDIHKVAERLCGIAAAKGRHLDFTDTDTILADMTAPGVRVLDIQKLVCNHYKIEHREMMSKHMAVKFPHPRQTAYYLCRCMTVHSIGGIARFFRRDRTTVLHGLTRVTQRLATDERYARDVELLRQQIIRMATGKGSIEGQNGD